MTVPKSRETSAVYICSNTGNKGTIFICSKTEDEGSILYAPRQGMRACNNNLALSSLHMFYSLVEYYITGVRNMDVDNNVKIKGQYSQQGLFTLVSSVFLQARKNIRFFSRKLIMYIPCV